MYSMCDIVFRLFLSIALLCQAGGAAYFAHFAHQQLRTYFLDHAMDADAHTAKLVYAYLFMTAVFSIVYSISALLSIRRPSTAEKNHVTCCRFVGAIFSVCIGVTVIAFGVITAKTSWFWWGYFKVNGLKSLEQNTHGLTAMTITILAITGCYLLGLAFVELATFIVKRISRSDEMKASKTVELKGDLSQEEWRKDLEAQLQAVEATLKR
ncbi:hypothetical protein DL769_008362 [Monosporascus sp. CRB-8-3]|nr:hypothetical protein DL769_008362 [Monosporascus sp. CRB-8-3]